MADGWSAARSAGVSFEVSVTSARSASSPLCCALTASPRLLSEPAPWSKSFSTLGSPSPVSLSALRSAPLIPGPLA